MKLHLITTEAIRADCFGEPIRFSETNCKILGLPGGSDSQESACNMGDPGLIPGREDPLEKGVATHSSILA